MATTSATKAAAILAVCLACGAAFAACGSPREGARPEGTGDRARLAASEPSLPAWVGTGESWWRDGDVFLCKVPAFDQADPGRGLQAATNRLPAALVGYLGELAAVRVKETSGTNAEELEGLFRKALQASGAARLAAGAGLRARYWELWRNDSAREKAQVRSYTVTVLFALPLASVRETLVQACAAYAAQVPETSRAAWKMLAADPLPAAWRGAKP